MTKKRRASWLGALAGAVTVAAGSQSLPAQSASGKDAGKGAAPAASTWTPSRTPWGDPDLQGVWTSDDMLSIPMERPEQFAGRAELTDEEFAERAKRDQQALDRNRKAVGAFRGD